MKQQNIPGRALFYMGVDGGGTNCRARIEDAGGRVLGRGLAGPAATRIGVAESMQAVTSASMAAAIDAGLPPAALAQSTAGVGLAGLDRRGMYEVVLRQPHPFRNMVCASDANAACLGAHSGRDGGIVIAGTGSVGLARVNGREFRIGGYGFPISDEGSGADLGLQAVRLALRAHDRRTTPTRFSREVMQRLGPEPDSVVAWSEQATATDYARLAPMVFDHAEAADPLAQDIVADGARQIDTLIRSLMQFGAPRISLLGGLALPFARWLSPDVLQVLSPPEGDAVAGALLLARGVANWIPAGSERPEKEQSECRLST
jgi:glucosamine kinase